MRERYRAGPIRIGVHGAPLSGTKSGIGRYVFELCQQLDRLLPDAEFFVYSQTPPSSPLPSNRWHLRLASGASRRLSGYGWLKFASRGLIRKDRLDAFWATRTLLPPLDRTTGSVSTVYDLNHILVPETMNTVNRVAHSLWLRRDVLNSDQVISISAGTAMRLEKHFGRVSDAIASPGTDERYRAASEIQIEEVLSRHGIAKPYLLAVGTLEPRKNLATLVHAFLALRQARELEFHTLVLAGPGGWKQSELSPRWGTCQKPICLHYIPAAICSLCHRFTKAMACPQRKHALVAFAYWRATSLNCAKREVRTRATCHPPRKA